MQCSLYDSLYHIDHCKWKGNGICIIVLRGQLNWHTHLVVEIAKIILLNKIVQMLMQLLNAFCHFKFTSWPFLTFWRSKMIEFNFDFLSFKTVFALTSVGFHFIPINTRFNPNFIGFHRFSLTITELKRY